VRRTHGYAQGNNKIIEQISGKRRKAVNIVAGLCNGKIIAPLAYQTTMNTDLFNNYLINYLLPASGKDKRIILDNARFHKILPETRAAFLKKRCTFLYLPPYAPDLNPIEKFWANTKKCLKQCADFAQPLIQIIQYIFDIKSVKLLGV
jgi:transposase